MHESAKDLVRNRTISINAVLRDFPVCGKPVDNRHKLKQSGARWKRADEAFDPGV